MTDKLKDEYIYIVSGHCAGGTSMTMRVMIFGGIEAIYNKELPIQPHLNNPHGVFEGDWRKMNYPELVGKVVKGIGVSWRKIPEEYPIKMIRIIRKTEDSAKSKRLRDLRKIEAGVRDKPARELDDLIEKTDIMKQKFEKKYAERKNIERLDINFEDMLNDTRNQCQRIADFVSPREFNVEEAILAVDKTIKHETNSK